MHVCGSQNDGAVPNDTQVFLGTPGRAGMLSPRAPKERVTWGPAVGLLN